jgi:hypothetical protein
MAALTTKRREYKNARLYFIPVGEVIPLGDGESSLTVSKTTWPDNTPPSNWTGYQFDDIETVKESKEFDTETFKIPAAAGGYLDDEEQTLKKRMWTAATAKTNNLLKQLEHALAAVPVVGTPQAPGAKQDNYLEGVMLLEIQNKDGPVIERTQVWARLRLVTAGDVGPATSKIEFSLEQRESGNNTFLLVA